MRIAIVGTRGIPAAYGGFETLAWELSTRLAARGHDVTVYCRRGRTDESIGVFKDVLMVAPLRPEVHRDFGDRLMAANRPREALVEYQALLAMDPQDLAEAHYRLAKTYVALDDRAKGREHLLYALEIAPHYREAQQLLLEVVR